MFTLLKPCLLLLSKTAIDAQDYSINNYSPSVSISLHHPDKKYKNNLLPVRSEMFIKALHMFDLDIILR